MMQNHYIVVTQTLEHVDHLVCRLLRPHLARRPIVILCPLYDWNCRADEKGWLKLAHYEDIHLLQGMSSESRDLLCAMLPLSHAVMVVSGKSQKVRQGDTCGSVAVS